MNAGTVFFVVPDDLDDPERVSGGNVYDQRLRDGLAADGWEVRMRPVAAADTSADTAAVTVAAAGRNLARTVAALPDDAVVLIDGLLVGREPTALLTHGARLRPVVLAHMVAADLGALERDALRTAVGIVATSRWTRAELIAQDAADPRRIVVAHPGADVAQATEPSASGSRLLCVAAVAPHKGQDLLVTALAGAAAVEGWTCTFAGSLAVAPEFAAELTAAVSSSGIGARVAFPGVLTGRALQRAYAHADLLVMPSRSESYGMAVAEALAHGVPVLATGVGGLSEAIGHGEAAMLVPPDDAWALGMMLRRWWADPPLRRRLQGAAMEARGTATPWAETTRTVAAALADAARLPVTDGQSAARSAARSAAGSVAAS